MSEYMDSMFDKAVKYYNKECDDNPILARNFLMGYLGAEQIENSCTLCTRKCPVRNDGIVNCEFRNDKHGSVYWYIGD